MFETIDEICVFEEIVPYGGELTYRCIELLELKEYDKYEFVKYKFIKVLLIEP